LPPKTPLVWLTAFLAALVLYAATLAPDVLMTDGGEYQWSTCLFPRIELPQGPDNLVRVHINYLALAKAFTSLVPLDNFAARVNLFSAFCAAIAAGNAAALTWLLTGRYGPVLVAWLSLCLGGTFWHYAVVAEVMALLAATVTAELLTVCLWCRTARLRWLAATWAINGLACGAHLQAALATPVYLALTVAHMRRRRANHAAKNSAGRTDQPPAHTTEAEPRVSPVQLIGFLALWTAFCAPYIAFCLLWASSLNSASFTVTSATVGSYGHAVFDLSARTLAKGALSIALNYPTGLILLALPGLRRLLAAAPRPLSFTLIGVYLVNLVFAMTYAVPDQHSFFVPFYAAISPVIGLGAVTLCRQSRYAHEGADRIAPEAAAAQSRVVTAWPARYCVLALCVLSLAVVPIYAVLPNVANRLQILKLGPEVPGRSRLAFYLRPWKAADSPSTCVRGRSAGVPNGGTLKRRSKRCRKMPYSSAAERFTMP